MTFAASPAYHSVELSWDETKRDATLRSRRLDFADVARLLFVDAIERPTPRHNEPRIMRVGLLNGLEFTLVYTRRDTACHIISARRASKGERRAYHAIYSG